MLKEHSVWAEGFRDTRKGNFAVVARRGADVHALYNKLKEYCARWSEDGVHVFLDGTWEDVVIHNVTYRPGSLEQDVAEALTDFHTHFPQGCKPVVQRITPLLPASERNTFKPHGVSVRVLVACPGLGNNLIREGVTVDERYCRVSRYKPRQRLSSSSP
jgi:hypothetical protein